MLAGSDTVWKDAVFTEVGTFTVPSTDIANNSYAIYVKENGVAGSTKVAYDTSKSFNTTWKTTDKTVTIPIKSRLLGYSYRVDWNNDGILEGDELTFHTDDASHTFTVAEDRPIAIVGDFPVIYVGLEKNKIISVNQWGAQKWRTFQHSFAGAMNLIYTTNTDEPNLEILTNLSNMFSNANNPDLDLHTSNWDTSTVKDTSYMFSTTKSNPDVSSWNTSNVIDMSFMFAGAIVADPTVKATNLDDGIWDTSKVEDMSWMFYNTTISDPDISGWQLNTTNTPKMNDMFGGFSDDPNTYSSMSPENYQKALIAFAKQDISGVIFYAGAKANYCSDNTISEDEDAERTPKQAKTHLTTLVSDGGLGWEISDATNEDDPKDPISGKWTEGDNGWSCVE